MPVHETFSAMVCCVCKLVPPQAARAAATVRRRMG